MRANTGKYRVDTRTKDESKLTGEITLAHLAGFDDIIDVRSPDEFAEDHIPGAINLPVLDNEERARVGTIYKQVSAFEKGYPLEDVWNFSIDT